MKKLLTIAFIFYALPSWAAQLYGPNSDDGTLQVPNLEERLSKVKTITILPVKIDYVRLDLGRTFTTMKKQSKIIGEHVRGNLVMEFKHLTKYKIKTKKLSAFKGSSKKLLEETQAMFKVLADNAHRYSGWVSTERFLEITENFDYTLGKEVQNLAKNTDAFLIAVGYDEYSTKGYTDEKNKQIFRANLTNTIIEGIYDDILLQMALVDAKTGEILWYSFRFWENDRATFKNTEMSFVVEKMTEELPGLKTK